MPVTTAIVEDAAPVAVARSSRRTLRVLQVIASVADVNGGASTAMWSTLKALRSRGIHSDLVTTNEDGPNRLMDVPLGEFIRQGEHTVRYFAAKGDRYTTSWPMARWLFENVRRYDMVHVHGLFRFAPAVAAHAALLRRVPYVLTLHNTLGAWGMQHRRPLLKKLSIGLIEGRILDGARKVHLCSPDELSQVTRVRRLGTRSAVFPLGLDLSTDARERPGTGGIESVRDTFAGRRIVLFMSRIHEIKGLDRLLTAFARIQRDQPDLVLVIAGTGDERLTARLRGLARQLGIEERTHWVGFVQGRVKHDLLSLATLFVLPSHSENFGYAVVEAMLAGLPVITTANVPSGEFVTAASAGIVYDGTTERLEQSIRSLLGLPESGRRQLGSRGALMVRDRLSLENFGESLERLYGEVCPAWLAAGLPAG